MREKGIDVEFKLQQMLNKIRVHSGKVEQDISGMIDTAEDSFKGDLKKTVEAVKDENKKVLALLEQLRAKIPLQ
jgi:hypothetical protein